MAVSLKDNAVLLFHEDGVLGGAGEGLFFPRLQTNVEWHKYILRWKLASSYVPVHLSLLECPCVYQTLPPRPNDADELSQGRNASFFGRQVMQNRYGYPTVKCVAPVRRFQSVSQLGLKILSPAYPHQLQADVEADHEAPAVVHVLS
eukprot:CAMPEP_0184485988 /NCGR_PEP_ID=MMETSP0113_2-20130426/7550_1 /TAXON_ID=91329 /ORGANISM="Norrisiella sphaerica, Strain BC52" /LENGTH=146 /DNA_ID=CAMNT_0026867675 /DNA_START=248 /DNA_END=685 /DNA_ORIENTATION=+